MFGYSGLKAVKYFLDGNSLNMEQVWILLVASVTAYLVSLVVIRFLTDFVKNMISRFWLLPHNFRSDFIGLCLYHIFILRAGRPAFLLSFELGFSIMVEDMYEY